MDYCGHNRGFYYILVEGQIISRLRFYLSLKKLDGSFSSEENIDSNLPIMIEMSFVWL